MRKLRVSLVALFITVLGLVGAPAQASHTCGLDGVPIVGPVCDGYHSPKLVIQYLVFCAQYPVQCI
jgi:hypothetical protein